MHRNQVSRSSNPCVFFMCNTSLSVGIIGIYTVRYAFCASIAGFERDELHSLLLVYFRRLAAKKAAASFKKSLSS